MLCVPLTVDAVPVQSLLVYDVMVHGTVPPSTEPGTLSQMHSATSWQGASFHSPSSALI